MESDVLSISGLFGACVEEEYEAQKANQKFGFIRQASARFFRSIKRAHRNISGSLSSVLTRQNNETEELHGSEQQTSSSGRKARRPHSVAFGEEFKGLTVSSRIGKHFPDCNHFAKFICEFTSVHCTQRI